ncbi:hypothetical protein NH340_JMT07582 [Sarcoptes scabiei]|nr:hypothetical protein NH340_JMT07582 [Sarcoptes scabiei]
MNQDELKRELYFLIYKFLENSPLSETFDILKKELLSKSLLPAQFEWTSGKKEKTNLDLLIKKNQHITADHLFHSLIRAHQALNEVCPPPVQSIVSFLSDGRFSLIRPIPKKSLINQDDLMPEICSNSLKSLSHHLYHAPVIPLKRYTSSKYPGPIFNNLYSQQLSGPKSIASLWTTQFYEQYKKYHRTLGHLSSVFCVLFDRTGRFLITGADDNLIKIWSAYNGRLFATLRGHQGEITDLSVSMENDMLASGSCDKKIKVWNLRTTAQITTFQIHEDSISSVKFCPMLNNEIRYLVSTSQDGSVCFFKYSAETRKFLDNPIRFIEKKRRDSQIVSSAFSAGGAFYAVGSTDSILYVYHLSGPLGPTKVLEIEQHSDHVDSLSFSNHSLLKFISGGRDGLAHIWNYSKQKWHNLKIDVNECLAGSQETNDETGKKGGIRVCMVAWSIDDQFVITSLTDSSIKIWWSHNAKLKHILYGHEDEVYIIEPHPFDSRILLTGGHDDAIVIWDIITGTNIKTFYNALEGQGSGSLFDAKWSPDGTMFAATDSHGHVMFFGASNLNPYEKMPEQYFFHTDYRPLSRDSNDYVIDEQMQIAPHLMPPPFLVDIDGNPYPPSLQRLVPGRENCIDSQLVPYVDNYQIMVPDQQRPNIDFMIQNLRQNLENIQQQSNNNHVDNNPVNHQLPNNVPNQNQHHRLQPQRNNRDVAQRRNGDVEGVRNSANFVSAGGRPCGMYMKKPLIPPMSRHEIETITARQNRLTEAEETYYDSERKKRSSNPEIIATISNNQKPKPFTRRQKRINIQMRGVRSSRLQNLTINDIDEYDDDENDKDFTGTSEDSSSEEDEEMDDSDWNQPSTSSHSIPTNSVCTRKRKKRSDSNASSDDDDENDERHQSSEAVVNGRDVMRNESSSNEPGPSNRRKKSVPTLDQPIQQTFDNLDERFRPPDWFTNSKPKRTPYFPQIGDEVVYFRQGHQNYIDAIRSSRCYNINSSIKPFKLKGVETDEIFAKIVGIQYQVKPPRLVVLKMIVIDPQAAENDDHHNVVSQNSPIVGQQFTVRYHDIDHVCDFIILKKLYDISIARDWRCNDEFRSVIDDKWWIGKIHSIHYSHKNSYFQSIEVSWRNGEKELLSPWDLELLNSNEQNHSDGIPVSDDERSLFSLIDENEWPIEQRERDRQRLLDGLIRIIQFSYAEDFAVPVDLNIHPIYAMMIPYPMDLSTVMARLETGYYRRIDAIKFDIKFIESNACLYNVPESEIVKKAKIITECCLRFIDDSSCYDPLPIYNEVSANYVPPASSETSPSDLGVRSSLRIARNASRRARRFLSDSDNETETTKINSHCTSRSKSESKNWKQLCRELIDHMFDLHESEPFRAPVDPIMYPNYSHVIDTPMDLTTVKEQLLADIYDSPSDFAKDMRLIFSNSKTYNTNKKSRIYSMTIRLSTLFEEKFREALSSLKSYRKKSRMNLKRNSIQHSRNSFRSRSPTFSPPSSTEYRPRLTKRNSNYQQSLNHNDLNQPTTSSASSSSVAISNARACTRFGRHYTRISTTMEKYGLRHRNKRFRTYKEESDYDDEENDHKIQSTSAIASNSNPNTNYHLRSKKVLNSSDYEEEEEDEEDLNNADDETDKTDRSEDEMTENGEQEDEEEEDDEEEEELDDEDEDEDDEGDDHNDSDATQLDNETDDDNKENTNRSRPIRAAARKRINYGEDCWKNNLLKI